MSSFGASSAISILASYSTGESDVSITFCVYLPFGTDRASRLDWFAMYARVAGWGLLSLSCQICTLAGLSIESSFDRFGILSLRKSMVQVLYRVSIFIHA
ncbi:hypothetical protein BT63DRAFT_214839 [Microthyrium microscopicum]|uniref:Uncharacterized protein n=1 Tax=Microthyrium microscopicum TaxID=703497 RepID=A0A6A6UGE3_9PEZI|nr:hypothetical protein BT63DRAFT_214839 [Microthyrium microscopicum]